MDVRTTFLILACLLVGCGEVTGAGSRPAAPTATAVIVAPRDQIPAALRDYMDRLTQTAGAGYIRRVDRIIVRPATWSDLPGSAGAANVDPAAAIWIIAATGEFYPTFGLMSVPPSACELWALDAKTYEVRGSVLGALSDCARYFGDLPAPTSAPITCGDEDSGYRVFDHYRFSPTTTGPLAIVTSRDDSWTAPTAIPGDYLYRFGHGSVFEVFCRPNHTATVPEPNDAAMLKALGSPRVTPAGGMAQIWLKNAHALSASAGSDGVVTVKATVRRGFEIVSYDWHALAPQGGYVKFRFVDASGVDVIPYAVANGP